jgi:glycosyltransferase involved in cell wall biosynthesis
MPKSALIDVVIPVYNEEKRLGRGVRECIEFFRKHGLSARLTIADNGSIDATEKVAEGLAREFPEMSYLKAGRKGVGLALKKAWSESQCEIVGYMDVDLATRLDHLLEVHELFKDPAVRIITGSRLLPGSVVKGRTLLRELTSRGFNAILKARLGVGFSDGMCGFKFLRRSFFDRIKAQASPLRDGWIFNTEILVKAEWLGVPVNEIPVVWEDDSASKVRLFKTVSDYLIEIEKMRAEKKVFSRRGA